MFAACIAVFPCERVKDEYHESFLFDIGFEGTLRVTLSVDGGKEGKTMSEMDPVEVSCCSLSIGFESA